jgi:cell division protein FtsL
MTPPDATASPRTARASRGTTHRRAPSRPPRRVSGPAQGARATRAAVPVPAGAGGGTGAAAPPLALRLARAGARIGDARLLDRLVRGRGWIALVAVGLMGIVFMQVSMLRLNAGISRAITAAETLEQQNSTLRADISKLDAGNRIADTAAAQGMMRPPAGDVNYLDARKADGAAAAKGIRKPDPVKTEAPAATQAAQQQAAVAPAAATAQPQAAPAQAATQTTATQQPAVAQQTVQPQAAAQPQQQAAAPPQETAAPQQQAAAPPQQTAAPPAAQTTTTAPTTTAGATTAQGAQ